MSLVETALLFHSVFDLHILPAASPGRELVPLERPWALNWVRWDEDPAIQLQKPGGKEETIINDMKSSAATNTTFTTTNNKNNNYYSGLRMNQLDSQTLPPCSNQSHCQEPCCSHMKQMLLDVFCSLTNLPKSAIWPIPAFPPSDTATQKCCQCRNWRYKLDLHQTPRGSPKRVSPSHSILTPISCVAAFVGKRERSLDIMLWIVINTVSCFISMPCLAFDKKFWLFSAMQSCLGSGPLCEKC